MVEMKVIPATWDFYEMIQAFLQAPLYHMVFEVILIVFIVNLLFSKSYAPRKAQLTEKEKEELLADWIPEPLVPHVPDDHPVLLAMEKNIIEGPVAKYMNVNNRSCLNLATFNFLNMIGNKSIETEALKSMRVYGVGSCGPRGFYGTMGVHLELEEKLASFMCVGEACLYAYGFATISSVIPAYAKKGDILYVDEGVAYCIQSGVLASRSTVRYFKHNDMDDLERLLSGQSKENKKNPKKAKVTREFMIVEGLYATYGDICPLPRLVELKQKYKVRLIIEESFSFGVLGATGKGVTEYFDIPATEIDQITASLENAIGSMGGFSCGPSYIVDHQRLCAKGYCFSASLPPMLAAAAIESIRLIESNTDMLVQLKERCTKMHEGLLKIDGMCVRGCPISPVQHLQLAEPSEEREMDVQTLRTIVEQVQEQGIVLTLAAYLESAEANLPPASIRISVNSDLTDDEIQHALSVLTTISNQVLQSRI